MIAFLLYKAGSYLSRVLPFKMPEFIAWTIGQFSCLFRRRTRRLVEENLRIVHGDTLSRRELRKKSRRVIMNFARCILVFLKIPTYEWSALKARCDLSGFERAVAALGERPVFIVVSAHVGPWELGGLCLSRLGYKVHTAALDHPSKRVTRFYDEQRRRVGVAGHPLGNAFENLQEALEKKEIVALLTDRAYGKARRPNSLFGVESEFPIGYLLLSVRCNVPVVTGAILLESGDRFRYVHGGVHFPPGEGGEIEKVDFLQAKCLGDFEKIIEAHSEQWFRFTPLKR